MVGGWMKELKMKIIRQNPNNNIKMKWQPKNGNSIFQMAAIRPLVSIALLALLFFSESLLTSHSLTGIPHRNILHTVAHRIVNGSVESSYQRKSNKLHTKDRRRIRPILISGSNGMHHKSAENRSRVTSFEVGSMLCICIFLGLFLWIM